MARDYSSRRSSSTRTGRKNTRRRAAARTSPRRRASSGTPGWVWMLCGLCIGLTVAAGFYVFGRPAGSPSRDTFNIATPESAADDNRNTGDRSQNTPVEQEEKEPRFSFYKMLPNYEVVIPEEEYPDQPSNSGTEDAPPPRTGEIETPQPTTPKVEEPGSYIIQAGSFSTYADADRRKAELALLGVTAQVVDVDLASGKTVYRVQSNSINSSDKLNGILKRLRENRIDTLVMRAKN